MALPFGPYQGQDLTNWQEGNKFLPRKFYSLNTAPSTTLANQIGNTGITNTQAAGSYMGYPSYEAWLLAQGGQGNQGGGGGGGPDIIEEDRFSMGMSPGAMGGKLPGFGNWAKRTAGTLGHIYSQLPTPGNLAVRGWKGIQRWRQNKKVEEEARLQQEIKDHNIAAAAAAQQATKTASGAGPTTGQGGQIDRGDLRDIGGGFHEYKDSGTAASYEGSFKKGGRIGYNRGRVVNPGGYQGDEEFEDENTLEFMQDQGIPYGEMASSPHPDESWLGLWEDLDSKGMVPIEIETLDDFKHWFHQQDFDMGNMSEDQGIASLV